MEEARRQGETAYDYSLHGSELFAFRWPLGRLEDPATGCRVTPSLLLSPTNSLYELSGMLCSDILEALNVNK